MEEILEQLKLTLERTRDDIVAGKETAITRLDLAQLLLADLSQLVKPK